MFCNCPFKDKVAFTLWSTSQEEKLRNVQIVDTASGYFVITSSYESKELQMILLLISSPWSFFANEREKLKFPSPSMRILTICPDVSSEVILLFVIIERPLTLQFMLTLRTTFLVFKISVNYGSNMQKLQIEKKRGNGIWRTFRFLYSSHLSPTY